MRTPYLDALRRVLVIHKNKFQQMDTGWSECISCDGNCENINITENTIEDNTNIGIDVTGNYRTCDYEPKDRTRYAYIADNTVKNCCCDYASSYGIYVDGAQHVLIENNTVENCNGGIEVGAEEPQENPLYATFDVLVKGNELRNNAALGQTNPGCAFSCGGYGKNLGWVRTVVFRENVCVDNSACENGVQVSVSKVDGLRVENNSFETSFESSLVRYGFTDSYTKNVSFRDNRCTFAGTVSDGFQAGRIFR